MREEARQAAEAAARRSYGRLLAILAGATRDIAAAEEALSEALVAALASWPERGVPANPEGWLLTAARRAHLDAVRHAKVAAAARRDVVLRAAEAAVRGRPFPDERLKLLFVCAHPAIDPAARTPLMLQAVLGLDAARIAAAFCVPPATMSQRLVRAKTKIRDAGLRYDVPEPADFPERIADVLQAVYAAYGTGWDAIGAEARDRKDLAGEAIHLGRLIESLVPDEPEPKGLLALMLYCEARRAARRDTAGRFVPLASQDAAFWSRDMIIEAEGFLTAASRHGRFGRFQCEAAIQSVHVQRAVTGVTNHAALRLLYDLLLRHVPSLGVIVGRAASILDSGDAAGAIDALAAASDERASLYQPYLVVRSRALVALGRREEAAAAMREAIGLTEDAAVRRFLAAEPEPLTKS